MNYQARRAAAMNDKMLHFLVCAAIAALTGILMMLVGATVVQTAIASVGAAMAAGLGKEYGDKNATGNHWCWVDLAADAAGAVVGTTVAVGLGWAIEVVF